jgi:hypothetical protein
MLRQAGLQVPLDPARVQAGQMVAGTSQLSRYPADEITKPTLGYLYVPVGRGGKMKQKVGEGQVLPPGHPETRDYGAPIPPDYAIVQILYVDDSFEDMQLDYPVPGQQESSIMSVLGLNVLWNKADIELKPELGASQRSSGPSGDPSDGDDSGDDRGGDDRGGNDRGGADGPSNSPGGSLGGPGGSPPRSPPGHEKSSSPPRSPPGHEKRSSPPCSPPSHAKSNLTGATGRPGTPHPKAQNNDSGKGKCSSPKMSETIWRDKYGPITAPRMAAYHLAEEYKYTTACDRYTC